MSELLSEGGTPALSFPDPAGARLRRWVLPAFFLSGITGLVYEGIWIRMLTLVVGGTTAALTTVLIAFMGGLALGSFLFGGLADRATRPLRVYAVVEVGVGLWACLLPAVYRAVPLVYGSLHAIDPAHGPLFHLLRFAFALAFFGIPATLMGGTLPLIVKTLSRATSRLQVTVAEVYAINTFGATLGAFLTGFVVLPTLGIATTLYATAAVNIALGLAFYLGSSRLEGPVPPSLSGGDGAGDSQLEARSAPASSSLSSASAPAEEAVNAGSTHWSLVVFFLMGASSLSYEVLWHRLLGLSFGSSVYAASTMLTAFLLGIAGGSYLLRRLPERFPVTLATLGWIEVFIAGLAVITGFLLSLLPHLVQYLFMMPYLFVRIAGPTWSDLGFWLMQLALFTVATLSMLLPTALMGASFPLATRLASRGGVGRTVGRVYASNTFGSIVGLTLTGFVLIEAFGTHATMTGWSVLNAGLGLGLLWLSRRREEGSRLSGRGLALTGAVLAALLILNPSWNLEALTSGVYYHAMELNSPTFKGEIVFHQEDDMGLVSVHRGPEWDFPERVNTLKFNGKFMASDGARTRTLRLLALLPLAARPAGAERALVIGLGGGYTAEAALRDQGLRQVDAVEISPAVIGAARFLKPALFNEKRLNIVQEDARALLITAQQPYDVIVSETSDPWMTGVSNLYTAEFFRQVRDRLAEDGVFGTWLQTRHKTVEDVRTILHTMQSVFPHFAVFQLAYGDTLLLMSRKPLLLRGEQLKRVLAGMEDVGVRSPWQVAGFLMLGENSARRWLEGAAINTDDLPVIEFSTPRSLNIGLRGLEVWEAVKAQAPARMEVPVEGVTPEELSTLETWRALHLRRHAEALSLASRLTSPEGRLLQARALYGLKRFEDALDVLRELPSSGERSLLETACLLKLGRYQALSEALGTQDRWPLVKGRQWDDRLSCRMRWLQAQLGEAVPQCGAEE